MVIHTTLFNFSLKLSPGLGILNRKIVEPGLLLEDPTFQEQEKLHPEKCLGTAQRLHHQKTKQLNMREKSLQQKTQTNHEHEM